MKYCKLRDGQSGGSIITNIINIFKWQRSDKKKIIIHTIITNLKITLF